MPSEFVATYRLQLHKDFSFRDAAARAGYFAELGISHLYLSPILQAAPGSTHGYDTVDCTRLSQDLGGEEGFAELLAACREHGLGLMLDIVPNHMAASSANRWWWDVLENGQASRYAEYFDIDWEAGDGRLLLPVLGDHYGALLERGDLSVVQEQGAFNIAYHEHRWPIAPRSLDALLRPAADGALSTELAWIADLYTGLPPATALSATARSRRHRDKELLGRALIGLMERPAIGEAVLKAVDDLNHDPVKLDGLLERQNYRIVHWRNAQEELGYRRFFDINSLVALRMERADVFEDCHRLILDLVRRGDVEALRIDHPDGLRAPSGYLAKLHECAPETPLYVEKILEADEDLPPEWRVAGTTGYDFMARLGALFVDPAGEEALTHLYTTFTGEIATYEDVRRDKKRHVLRTVLGSDLHRLTDLLSRVSRADWPHRDYPWSGLRKLLLEILVEFPVYREYPERASVELSQSRPEGRYAREAVASARGRNPELDSRLLDFVGALLTKPQSDPLPQEFGQRFYQLSAPAMAKGAEDTAFYMYNRLIALNEVGGDPGRFGIDLRTWHDACSSTAAVRPQTLLASATHDTKRGEDTRARLTLLAQAPERWQRAVEQLARCADAYRSKCAAGVLPDANTEYFLYQTLIGVWPVETERLSEYMLKAVREAKVHTCWLRPVEEYEQGLKKFITAVMADVSFRQVVGDLVAELNEPARIVGLAQTLIKLTAPGVPDIYQGTELWHHVLVDPDNRRPVDFSERERLLQESVQLDAAGTLARGYMGLTKMRVLRLTLACRRRFADAFAPGARYACVKVHGRDADAVVAYERGERIAVLVPRFPLRYPPEAIEATADLAHGSWSAIFSDEEFDGGRIDLKRLWRNFPVALLVRN